MPPSTRVPRRPRRPRAADPAADPASAPYDARDSHEIRRQILDAAHELLITRGYDRFSLREVARVLGKSSGSPYYHFATKDELIWTMIEEAFGQIYAAIRDAVEGAAGNPRARCEAMCRAYVRYALAHPTHYDIVFRRDALGLAPVPRERLRAGRMTMRLVASVLEADMRAGAVRPGEPGDSAFITAGVIWATLHGAVSIATGVRLDPAQGFTTDQLVEATVRSIVARYTVEPGAHDL